MQKLKESVLYYHTSEAGSDKRVRLLKSVMVRLGVRIRNVEPGQVLEKVGYLAGMPGYLPREEKGKPSSQEASPIPAIDEDILVLRNFTGGRMDFLLYNLKKANVPKIALKAMITPQNAEWTFYQLYEELKKERAAIEEGLTDGGGSHD